MKTIFLAEGEKQVRAALRLMLEHKPNFEIDDEADKADSLQAQVCVQPPDVILLDCNLPGLHHRRLLPAQRESCPDTIIPATGAKPELRKIIQGYQLDGFLSKLLSPKDHLAGLSKSFSPDAKSAKTHPIAL